MGWYTPSQSVRKANAGTRCPGCSLYMHHKDMVAWSGDAGTLYLHDACAEILLTQEAQEEYVIPDENLSAAEETTYTDADFVEVQRPE